MRPCPDGVGAKLRRISRSCAEHPGQGENAYAAAMLAVQFDLADPGFPASLADLPDLELPGAAWARVAVTIGGICGSDLHLFAHNTGPSPTLTRST